MEEANVNIVAGCDDGFSRPLAVALYSALKHLREATPVALYLIDGGVSRKSKKRIERVVGQVRPDVRVTWTSPAADAMQGLEGARHLSPATYLRLFIPELVPTNMTRVLYLDCDILVQGDLAELWGMDMAGALIAATRDFAVTDIGHAYSGVNDYCELGLDSAAPYFNAGILLMDIAQWRTKKTAEKALAYAVKHGATLGNCDQDALNATLSDAWLPLDFRWNMQSALFYLHDIPANNFVIELAKMRPTLLNEAKIFHFTGTPKPWNHWCGHPATEEWVKTLLQCGWFTPVEAVKWMVSYSLKRIIFKLKVVLGLYSIRERVN